MYGFCLQELSKEEREPFNAQAKREKQNRRYCPQPDKMDCTGQYISVSDVITVMYFAARK